MKVLGEVHCSTSFGSRESDSGRERKGLHSTPSRLSDAGEDLPVLWNFRSWNPEDENLISFLNCTIPS